jgi:hypothetical protein
MLNMNSTPPRPPSKNADRKALAAYFSELRRWANALEQWEADLDERESVFEEAMDEASDEKVRNYANRIAGEPLDEDEDEDEMDCECDAEAAAAGCDCPKCEAIREAWVEESRLRKEASKVRPGIVTKSDEMDWLENLWKLEDNRK